MVARSISPSLKSWTWTTLFYDSWIYPLFPFLLWWKYFSFLYFIFFIFLFSTKSWIRSMMYPGLKLNYFYHWSFLSLSGVRMDGAEGLGAKFWAYSNLLYIFYGAPRHILCSDARFGLWKPMFPRLVLWVTKTKVPASTKVLATHGKDWSCRQFWSPSHYCSCGVLYPTV